MRLPTGSLLLGGACHSDRAKAINTKKAPRSNRGALVFPSGLGVAATGAVTIAITGAITAATTVVVTAATVVTAAIATATAIAVTVSVPIAVSVAVTAFAVTFPIAVPITFTVGATETHLVLTDEGPGQDESPILLGKPLDQS